MISPTPGYPQFKSETKLRHTNPRAVDVLTHACVFTPSHSHSPGSSGVLTCAHTLTQSLSWAGSHSHMSFPKPQLSLMLPFASAHSYCGAHPITKSHPRLIITLSLTPSYTLTMPPPHTHRHSPLWKHIQSLSHLTHRHLLPQAHQRAQLHLLAPPPAHSLLHSCCRRVLHHGAPRPPQPAHTYGKLPKVAAPPLPLRPRGTSIRLSGSNGGAPRRRKFSPASAMTFDPERRVALGPFERPHVVFKAPSPTGNPSHLPARPSPGTSACSRCQIEPCPGTGSEAQARPWSQAGALRPERHIPPRP